MTTIKKAIRMTTTTNYDYIQTAKSTNGKYECERCQIEFNDPSEVFWAECGDYSKKHGVPLCQECCEDQQENWETNSDDEEECDGRDAPNIYPYKKCYVCGERKSCGNYRENDWFCETCAEEEDHATASSPRMFIARY